MASRTVKSSGIEFEAIEPSDLDDVAIAAQALDNQWVPRAILGKMIEKGLALDDVRSELERHVRTEYLRGLVNARQVVINRAYLYNNPAVFRDYLMTGPNRDAFKVLLSSGVIIPYLFGEQTPIDDPAFTTDPRGFPAWRHLCQEVRMQCVRLSWDDEANRTSIRDQLSRRFHAFALDASSSDESVLARDLGLAPGAATPLLERLTDMGRAVLDIRSKGYATREELYHKFVTADNSRPEEGKYDKSKPFAGEIKQLLDLKYNTNLPDAIGRYALTPIDSLPRTALQEWQEAQQQREITAEELVTLLRQSAFALVQEGLYVKSLGSLSLSDIQGVRSTDEWAEYVGSLDKLLDDPLGFPDPDRGAWAVYRSYVDLCGAVTKLVADRRTGERTARWTPIVELVLDVAGALLSVVWSGQGVLYQMAGSVSSSVARKAAPVVGRLIVRGFTEAGSRADMRTSVDFMRRRMVDAQGQWDDLTRLVPDLPGFQEAKTAPKAHENAIISYPGEGGEDN